MQQKKCIGIKKIKTVLILIILYSFIQSSEIAHALNTSSLFTTPPSSAKKATKASTTQGYAAKECIYNIKEFKLKYN